MSGVPKSRIDLLKAQPLLAECSDRDLARVSAMVDDIEVFEGEVLATEGRQGRELFIIVSGEAEASLNGRVLANLGPGQPFGEMALLDHEPRSATVRALTPMHLLVVSHSMFPSFLQQPGVAVRLLKEIARRLRTTQGALT